MKSFLANAKGALSATDAAKSIVPVYRHKYSGAGRGTRNASAIKLKVSMRRYPKQWL